MLRKSAHVYNTIYDKSSPQIHKQDLQSSYKKPNHNPQLELEEQMKRNYENNPTRRVHTNEMQGIVNQTKVKRPTSISNGNNPYIIGGSSYKLEKLSPYSSKENEDSHNKQPHYLQNNKSQQNNSQASKNFPKTTNIQYLVSVENITNRNPSPYSSKKSNPYSGQNHQIVNKENNQPNANDSQQSHHINSQNNKYPNKSVGGQRTANPSFKPPYSSKPIPNQHQNDFLLPIVNTNGGNNSHHSNHTEINNFHSNALSEESSISPGCDSRISQADQSAYLKQKLLETHAKLLKELEISKQLEDNFFELKKKYEEAISLLNKHKSSKESDNNISNQENIQHQLKQSQQKQTQWNSQKLMLTEKISQLTAQNQYLSAEIEEMTLKLRQFILQNHDQKQKQTTFKYSSNQIQQLVCQEKIPLQEELMRQTHKNAELKNDLENMRSKVLQLIKEKESNDEELASATEQKQFFACEVKLLQEKLSKKEKEFSEKQELCEIWRKKYSDAQEQYENVYESSIKNEKQSKELKNFNNELNIALRQEKQKNAQMLSEIINIQMQTKELKSKVSSLEEEKKNLQDKLFEHTQQKNLLHQKLELEHNIEKLTHQYNSLSAIINKKDKQISDLSNEVMEKNNILHKLTVREKQLEIKERQLEKREREFNDQKMSRITSVRDFVNKLEEDKERSVGLRRVSQNCLQNGGYNQVQNQQIMRQNVLNQSSSMRFESGNTTPTRQFSPISNNSKTLKGQFPNKMTQPESSTLKKSSISAKNLQTPQNQQRSLTPSKSLSGLKISNLPNYNHFETNNQKILICENREDEGEEYYQEEYDKYGEEGGQQRYAENYEEQHNCNGGQQQYESAEDSLQLVRMINNINPNNIKNPIKTHSNHIQPTTHTNLPPHLQMKQLSSQPLHAKPSPPQQQISSIQQTEQKQRQLSSYKEEKQQYLSLLEEIGELETQNYNLNQEKKKIVEELDKIESTKTKTKEIIARRRQLELWLLGNQKKNNQVKEKLKLYRGKVI